MSASSSSPGSSSGRTSKRPGRPSSPLHTAQGQARRRAAPGMRVVASVRGKPVNVDVAAATELGRVVLGTPGRNAESVADLCIGMLLDRCRHIGAAARLVRDGEWAIGLDDDSLVPYIRF